MHSFYYKTFNYLDNFEPKHLGIYFSLILHLLILLFAIGLPDFFKSKKIFVPQVIPIEILNISDVTSLKPKKESIEINNKENKKIKQKNFNSSKNTEIQKINLQEKPKNQITKNVNIPNNNSMIQKPESKNISLKEKQTNNLKKEKILELNKVETLNVNKITPKLKPTPAEKIELKSDKKIDKPKPIIQKNIEDKKIDKPKPIIQKNIEDKKIDKPKPKIQKNIEDKKIDKPKPIQKPEPDFNLATMLKDLRNEDIENVLDDNDIEEKEMEQEKNDIAEANLEVSISEMDLVIQQLRSCFNPRAGTKIEGDEMVKISAKIDRQANVRKDTVQIIATNISKSNPYYESITESAVATLYNPLCSKLKLPLDKYESWKDLKITIDYSWINN